MTSRAEQGDPAAAASEEANTLRRTLIIVSSSLGATIIAILAAVVVVVMLRRRRRQRAYDAACARDPSLTRPEYEERHRRLRWLTAAPSPYHARNSGDEEAQRSDMIRKSLQSRSMVNVAGAGGPQGDDDAPPTPQIPHPAMVAPRKPTRMRSRTWNGGRHRGGDEDGENEQLRKGEDRGGDDADSAQARVDYMWQLLNRKGGYSSSTPSPGAGQAHENPDDQSDGFATRPPTVRLKTPPLLSHPAFRSWGGDGHRPRTPKHSSLPTELTALRPSPL